MINEQYIVNESLIPSLDIFKSNPTKFKETFQQNILSKLKKAHDTVSREDAVMAILLTIIWITFSPHVIILHGFWWQVLFDVFFLTIIFYILDQHKETRLGILSGITSGINKVRQDLKKKIINATGKEKSLINQVLKKIDEGQKKLEAQVGASLAGGN